MRSVRNLTLAVLVCSSASSVASAGDVIFDSRGFQPNRTFFSELPYEHIDPLTGNLLLTFTDLVLPGNAGFDLKIQRTYNSKIHRDYATMGFTLDSDSWAGVGWTLHLGRVFHPYAANPGPVEMPDGSQHQLFARTSNPDGFGNHITRSFWIFDGNSPLKLRLPNGIVYTFGHLVTISGEQWAYVTEIADTFGNRVTVSYMSDPYPDEGISEIRQYFGSSYRTVTFTASSGERRALASMRFNGASTHTWSYTQDNISEVGFTLLTEVDPPVGTGWEYSYYESSPTSYELKKITTPNGGTITYGYGAVEFRLGRDVPVLSRVVTSRATGGRAPSGTWTYSYAQGSDDNETVIATPCGTTETYRFLGVGDYTYTGEAWKVGLMDRRVLKEGSTTLETVTQSWTPSPAISYDSLTIGNNYDADIYVAMPDVRATTWGSTTYSTNLNYRSTNFADYAQPSQTIEDGSLDRTITHNYWYGASSSLYLKALPLSETVTVSGESFTTSRSYNNQGFRTYEDVYGIRTDYSPDSRGNVGSETNDNNHTTSYSYTWSVVSTIDRPVSGTDTTRSVSKDSTITWEERRGHRTNYQYDALMRRTVEDPPVGNNVNTTYDNSGDSTWTRTTRGSTYVETTLDGFGRPIATVNAVGIQTRNVFDACGRTTYESYPYQPSTYPDVGTSYQYDGLDRLKRKTNPGSSYATYAYQSDGIDVAITDEESRTTTFYSSAFGDPRDSRLMSVKDAGNATTSYAYSAVGSLTSVDPPAGPNRTFHYNSKNLMDWEQHPELGRVDYTYKAAGNLASREDDEFGTTTYDYDNNERLASVNRPGSAHDLTIGYDGSDNRTLLQNGHVRVDMLYDGANRLDYRDDTMGGHTFRVDYHYDANDNVDYVVYPSGRRVNYGHDNANRITSVTDNGTGTVYANSFAYHPSGALTQLRPGGGTRPLQQFSYTNRYWLDVSNTPHRTLDYGYDDVGNVTSIGDGRSGMSRSFQPDSRHRLYSASGPWGSGVYNYDDIGNRTTSTMPGTPNQSYSSTTNRLTSAGGTSFSYDDNGNLTHVDGQQRYSYTPANMLETGGGATYRYDGDNVRKVKILGSSTRYYVHGLGGQILSEMTSPSRSLKDYIYAGGRLIASFRPQQPTVTFQADTSTAGEGAGTWAIPVTITTADGGTLPEEVRMDVSVLGLTATDGADFLVMDPLVVFEAGVPSGTVRTISLTIIDDTLEEAAETLQLTLAGADNAEIGAIAQHVVTIEDNEPAVLTVYVTGAGTVSSTPAGIACPGTCTADFAKSTQVTLTATPQGGGAFLGWTGACVTSPSTTCVLSMDTSYSTTARFGGTELRIGDAMVSEGDGGSTQMTFTVSLGGDLQNLVPLDGLSLWLRADQGVAAQGGQLVSWADQSPRGLAAASPTTGARPTYLPDGFTEFPHPVVRFDGTDDVIDFDRLTGIRTVFWVVRATPGSSGYRFLLGDPTSYDFHSGDNQQIWSSQYTPPAVRDGQTRLNGTPVDGTAMSRPETMAIISLSTTGPVTASNFSKDRAQAGRFWHGDLAELLVFERSLSSDEREDIEAYLSAKYEIELQGAIPTDGLALWLRADEGVEAEGGQLVAWRDQSPNSNDASPPTSAARPTYLPDGFDGFAYPAVHFDGANHWVNFTRLTGIRTVFWVVRETPNSPMGYRFLLGDSQSADFCGGDLDQIWSLIHTSPYILNGLTLVNRREAITYEPRPTQMSIISVVTTAGVTAGNFSYPQGRLDRLWRGDLSELLIYQRALSPSERMAVEDYLAGKYQITLEEGE